MKHLCIFCRGRTNSKEHAWPEWLLEALCHPSVPSETEAQFRKNSKAVYYTGPEVTINCVCRKCNQGWMSGLEAQAKRILLPLSRDISISLTTDEQTLLSRWAMKTAMVFEGAGDLQFYKEAERLSFSSQSKIPSGSHVWIGRYDQSNLLCGEGRHLLDPGQPHKNPFADGLSTTLVMSRLVMQVLNLRRKQGLEKEKAILRFATGSWETVLVKIWPTQHNRVTWPPTKSFSDHDIDVWKLSRRFVYGR